MALSLENESRNTDSCTLPSSKVVMPARLVWIVAMINVRVGCYLRCRTKTREHLGAYSMTGIEFVWRDISSMSTKKEGFLLRTDSVTGRENFSEFSA